MQDYHTREELLSAISHIERMLRFALDDLSLLNFGTSQRHINDALHTTNDIGRSLRSNDQLALDMKES